MTRNELITLCQEYFIYGTYQIDVSPWIKSDCLIRLDLSEDIPKIHREKNSRIEVSDASQEEIDLIVTGVQLLPKLKPIMYKYQIHQIFLDQEKAAIRAYVPEFIELLLMADDPVDTSRIVPYLKQLQQGGIISKERYEEITGDRE